MGPDTSRSAHAHDALGDPIRLRLLSRITSAPEGELCVCDIAGNDVDVSGPTISRHLTVLRQVGLVQGERRVSYRPQLNNLRQRAILLGTPIAAT